MDLLDKNDTDYLAEDESNDDANLDYDSDSEDD